VTAALENEGYQVQVAHNMSEAMTMAGQFHPALAIIDYYIPDGNGDEVCRAFKANEQLSNIALVMHSQRKENLAEALEAGAMDLIWKEEHQGSILAKSPLENGQMGAVFVFTFPLG